MGAKFGLSRHFITAFRDSNTGSKHTLYKDIQSMFCVNMDKLKAFKEKCIKYDTMDALMIPKY